MRRIDEEVQTAESSGEISQRAQYAELEEETVLESGTPMYLSEGRIIAIPVNA